MEDFLERCLQQVICLSAEEFDYRVTTVVFYGSIKTYDGLMTDPEKDDAILNMLPTASPKHPKGILGLN